MAVVFGFDGAVEISDLFFEFPGPPEPVATSPEPEDSLMLVGVRNDLGSLAACDQSIDGSSDLGVAVGCGMLVAEGGNG